MTNEQDGSLAARHMHVWGRAADAARHYMTLKRQCQDQGVQEVREAREALVGELAALLEIAMQLDRELPAWQREFYVKATRNMIEACGITEQEIDDYKGVG